LVEFDDNRKGSARQSPDRGSLEVDLAYNFLSFLTAAINDAETTVEETSLHASQAQRFLREKLKAVLEEQLHRLVKVASILSSREKKKPNAWAEEFAHRHTDVVLNNKFSCDTRDSEDEPFPFEKTFGYPSGQGRMALNAMLHGLVLQWFASRSVDAAIRSAAPLRVEPQPTVAPAPSAASPQTRVSVTPVPTAFRAQTDERPVAASSQDEPTESSPTPPSHSEELSYDEISQILKFRGKSYLKINKFQFAAVKRVCDAKADGCVGVSGKVLTKFAGLHGPEPRLRNAYQHGDAKELYRAAFSYDTRSGLYFLKSPARSAKASHKRTRPESTKPPKLS
jgi:hypothetical protein